MIECNENENNKESDTSLESSGIFRTFLIIILGGLAFLICCYLLFIFPEIITHILYSCFLGLGIGGVISYGLQQNKSSNKDTLFIITLLYSVITCFIFCFIYKYISIKLMILPILYSCFLGLGIRGIISSRIKQNKFLSKKILFILILLSSFFAYLVFSLILYISYSYTVSHLNNINFLDFVNSLKIMVKSVPFSLKNFQGCQGVYESYNHKIYLRGVFVSCILGIYNKLTLDKLHQEEIIMIINVQLWIAQFFITYFCVWKYVMFKCPWLFPQDCFSRNKKELFSFFIKRYGEKVN